MGARPLPGALVLQYGRQSTWIHDLLDFVLPPTASSPKSCFVQHTPVVVPENDTTHYIVV